MRYYIRDSNVRKHRTTVQKVIQDLVAPDVRELKALVLSLQQQMELRFEVQEKKTDLQFDTLEKKIDSRFDAQEQRAKLENQKADLQFRTLMAAFGEFKAQSELSSIRVISQLSERVAVLEASR